MSVTWLVVARFEGPVDLNDDGLLNAIDSAIESAGGIAADEIIGNLTFEAGGSVDDAFDVAREILAAEPKR